MRAGNRFCAIWCFLRENTHVCMVDAHKWQHEKNKNGLVLIFLLVIFRAAVYTSCCRRIPKSLEKKKKKKGALETKNKKTGKKNTRPRFFSRIYIAMKDNCAIFCLPILKKKKMAQSFEAENKCFGPVAGGAVSCSFFPFLSFPFFFFFFL